MPRHLTFVIENDGGTYNISLYIDGAFYATVKNTLNDIEKLYYLTLWFGRETITEGCSVCFDNLQIMGFGNGDGSYSGSISDLFSGNGQNIKLQTISDSVIYDNNNESEE